VQRRDLAHPPIHPITFVYMHVSIVMHVQRECVCVYACVCVCACMCEREREIQSGMQESIEDALSVLRACREDGRIEHRGR